MFLTKWMGRGTSSPRKYRMKEEQMSDSGDRSLKLGASALIFFSFPYPTQFSSQPPSHPLTRHVVYNFSAETTTAALRVGLVFNLGFDYMVPSFPRKFPVPPLNLLSAVGPGYRPPGDEMKGIK